MNESKDIDKKLKISDKIYPFFSGLSNDLIFFIIIDTLFYTNVKHLTASDINLISTIGTLVGILVFIVSPRIIRKIGNMKSIRIGMLFALIASVLYTFSNNLAGFITAEILYEVGFLFRSVEAVILSNDLNYENKSNEYVKIKTKCTTIYSLATIIASLLGGILFNINPYIPMILCIITCSINFVMSFFIYEIKNEKNNNESKSSKKFSWNKIIVYSILIYALLYGTVVICQRNDKLMLQFKLEEGYETAFVTMFLSIVLFLSRISRLLMNLIFVKIHLKLKDNVLYLLNGILFVTVVLVVIGKLISSVLIGSIFISIGFILILTLRDPVENVTSDMMLRSTKESDKETAIIFFGLIRRIVVFIISLLATLILKSHDLIDLYYILLVVTFSYFIIIKSFATHLKKQQAIK